MPTKRKRILRAAKGELTWAQLTLVEKMALWSSWAPGSLWAPRLGRTWAEYLTNYDRVRADCHAHTRTWPGKPPIFAERVRCYADRHGIEALETASHTDIRSAGTW